MEKLSARAKKTWFPFDSSIKDWRYFGGHGKRQMCVGKFNMKCPPPLFKVNSITWIYGFQYHTYAIFPLSW